ncbi:MAG: ABC transporter ATP-binding protein [Acidobacteria bacterium]|nr:ABC transporter ATP-binding protein [Acidobacteriota bacterium]
MSVHEPEVLGRAYDARLMRRLLGYLRPHRRSVGVALATIAAGSVLQLAQPWLTKVAIDDHIAPGDLDGLDRIALAFLLVLAGSFVLEYVQTWTMQMMGQRIMFDLRMEIYRHLQRLDLRFYDRNPVGRLMTRVTSDVDTLNELFTSGVVTVFRDVFMLAGIMIVLLWMDWRLALVTFAVLPAIAWVTHWFRMNARESYRRVRLQIARINAFLQENISGMATVQLFRREARNFEQFAGINRAHRDANLESIFYYATFYPAIEVLGAVATALIVWYGGGRALQDTVELGALVAFLQYSQRFFKPISDLSEKFNILQSAMASSERIFGLLDTPVEIASPAAPAPRADSSPAPGLGPRPALAPPPGAVRIRFEHVWFAYRGDEYVLRDVSFEVGAGERVGVVGATGAGKTTLINLLMRFYDVDRGRITVDGVDVREMPLADLRQRFGLVLQDVYLFSGSVRENIRLGHDAIGDAAVQAAARSVHADRFIERLPAGLDSEVGERGATLSVGQRQLLSFARALAFAPEVLLLDEATSSVDTDTERLIQDALHVLMAERTTIAIAHRLSTVQDMDQILVFHKGELREAGTHQQLLARRGLYHTLYQLQYRDQERAAAPERAGAGLTAPEPAVVDSGSGG